MPETDIRFDESILDKLPDNPAMAGKLISDYFHVFNSHTPPKKEVAFHDEYLKAYALLHTFLQKYGIDIGSEEPSFDGNFKQNIVKIKTFYGRAYSFFQEWATIASLEEYGNHFKKKLNQGFSYHFSDGDVKRIQVLLNQLRELIVDTEELGKEHRERLLKKLEKLQSELHKTMSDLDRFWGLLIEGGVVLQLIGEKAKPILECIEKISRIVWLSQAIATGLPSNAPLQLHQLPGCSPEATDGKET